MAGKHDKKKDSQKAKQSGNGNNRNQSNQRRQNTRSQKPPLVQQSESGKKVEMNTFVSAKDRSAMTKTKTPFQSPAGQQVPTKGSATSNPRLATGKGNIGTTSVDHGANSSQQQNRVPSMEVRDPTATLQTEHVARVTKENVPTRSHSSMTAQNPDLVTYESETAQMYFAPNNFTRSTNDDDQYVSDAEAAQQAEINADLSDQLHRVTNGTPPKNLFES